MTKYKKCSESECVREAGHTGFHYNPDQDSTSFRDIDLVYYGPHSCQKCDKDGKKGTLIVKAGNGAPDDLEFDFVHGSHYPNHLWRNHVCSGKNIIASRLGSLKSKKKSRSSRLNGKKGGRPKFSPTR